MVSVVAARFGAVIASAYFGIGRVDLSRSRSACPCASSTNGAMISATIVRGWHATRRG